MKYINLTIFLLGTAIFISPCQAMEPEETSKVSLRSMKGIHRQLTHHLTQHASQDNSYETSHIILGSYGLKGLGLERLSDAERARILQSFNNGNAIIHLYPQPGVIEETFKALNVPVIFADDPTKIELHALCKTPQGLPRQYTFAAPNNQTEENYHKERAATYRKWLETIKPTNRANFITTNRDPQNVLDLIDGITDYHAYQNWSGKDYHVTTYVKPISLKLSSDSELGKQGDILYLFWVGQDYVLTPNVGTSNEGRQIIGDDGTTLTNEGQQKTLWAKELCALEYSLSLLPTVDNLNVITVRSSPEGTEGSTNISSTISYGFSGNIGFFGMDPTGGLGGSYSISKSEARSMPDVTVNNQIDKSIARWNFQLKEGSNISKNTLQPYLQTLWMVKKEDAHRTNSEGFSIRTEFKGKIRMLQNYRTLKRQSHDYQVLVGGALNGHYETHHAPAEYGESTTKVEWLEVDGIGGPPRKHDFIVPFPPDPLSDHQSPQSHLIMVYSSDKQSICSATSTDGLNWNPSKKLNAAILESPAVAKFQNNLYCAVQGMDKKPWVLSSTNGENWSDASQVPSSHCMSFSPSLVTFNQQLFLAYHGADNNSDPDKNIYYTATNNGSTWHDPIKLPGDSKVENSPYLFIFKNKLHCGYSEKDGNSNKIMYTRSEDGVNWDPKLQVSTVNLSYSPSFIDFNNKLYCFYHDENNTGMIKYTSTSDLENWSPVRQISNVSLSYMPTLSVFNGKLYCAYQGVNNAKNIHYTSTSDGGNWAIGLDHEKILELSIEGSPALATFTF